MYYHPAGFPGAVKIGESSVHRPPGGQWRFRHVRLTPPEGLPPELRQLLATLGAQPIPELAKEQYGQLITSEFALCLGCGTIWWLRRRYDFRPPFYCSHACCELDRARDSLRR